MKNIIIFNGTAWSLFDRNTKKYGVYYRPEEAAIYITKYEVNFYFGVRPPWFYLLSMTNPFFVAFVLFTLLVERNAGTSCFFQLFIPLNIAWLVFSVLSIHRWKKYAEEMVSGGERLLLKDMSRLSLEHLSLLIRNGRSGETRICPQVVIFGHLFFTFAVLFSLISELLKGVSIGNVLGGFVLLFLNLEFVIYYAVFNQTLARRKFKKVLDTLLDNAV